MDVLDSERITGGSGGVRLNPLFGTNIGEAHVTCLSYVGFLFVGEIRG